MIPVTAKIRFRVSGYMDFQPTAQPLVAGRLGWVGRGEPGWIWGLAAASMPRTPPPSPPARPLTHCGGSARHGKKKEDQEQKRHSRYPCPASIQQISSTHGVDLPCRPRSTPTGNRDLPTVTGKLSGVGRCGLAGPLAPWMAPSSPQGRVYGVSRQPTPIQPPTENSEPTNRRCCCCCCCCCFKSLPQAAPQPPLQGNLNTFGHRTSIPRPRGR